MHVANFECLAARFDAVDQAKREVATEEGLDYMVLSMELRECNLYIIFVDYIPLFPANPH